MNKGFWDKLRRPIVGLAPMDGVTDAPMRFITAKYGRPSVIYTEFVNVEGITRNDKLLRDLKYDEIERPIVAQIFGGNPQAYYEAAKLIVSLGFDGIDINMGCPAKKVAKRGEGAGLIKDHKLAGEIINAVKEGVEESRIKNQELRRIPVSVKTRLGYDEPDPKWWEFLATQDLAAVAIHGRTFKQMYTGRADWSEIAKMASLINQSGTLVLGNGDIQSLAEAKNKAEKYHLDGVLIGRGAIGNPWVFRDEYQVSSIKYKERMKVMVEHAKKFEELFPNDKFFQMRKHLSWYAKGFKNAKELRQKLVQTNSSVEVEACLGSELKTA